MGDRRLRLANTAFEYYCFGEDVEVTGADGWDSSDSSDFTRMVYISGPTDAGDSADRVSFHVRFDPDGVVRGVYGLLMSNGGRIGALGLGPACPETLSALFGGTWGEHPRFPASDWAAEAASDSTRLGYWEWVANQVELAQDEAFSSDVVEPALRRELTRRFPELLGDSELDGCDAVDRLAMWFGELGGLKEVRHDG